MSETAPQRFMFDTSFDLEALKAVQEKKAPTVFSEEEMALAKEQSHDQGFVAGKEAAMRDLKNHQHEILANIQLIFERMADEVWKGSAEKKQASGEIALAIARKIIPDFIRKNGVQEITAAVESCVTDMINEPRMVLRISDAQFDDVSREINALTARIGYAGKMIILADSTLTENDCRLEWADGGMERSVNLTWSEIERQLHRHQSHPQTNSEYTPHPPDENSSTTDIAV
ncbi:MAG: hypothetical protein EB059_03685 [Alphaproteobacteria bacterium]|nr:hypothetical protein [Alphaproteobacteria bacterium]